jgi:hypothetical protein
MIELNIPINVAIMLLMERMQSEFDMRVRMGNYTGLQITDLDVSELYQIAEIAAFDLVFMLPAEIYEEENNLTEVVSRTMRGVSEKFGNKMFDKYTEEQAANLIRPIRNLIYTSNKKKSHIYN